MRYSPSQPIICPICGTYLSGPVQKKHHAEIHPQIKEMEEKEPEEQGVRDRE